MSPEERYWRERASLAPTPRRLALAWAPDWCELMADLLAIEGLDPDPFALRPGDAALLRGETLPGAMPDEPAGRLWADLHRRMAEGPDLPGGPLAMTEAP